MPGDDGYGLIRKVRAREARRGGQTSTLMEVRALATPQLLVEVNATGFLGGSV